MGNKWSKYTNEELLKMLKDVVEKNGGDLNSHSFNKHGLPTIDYYTKILKLKNKSKSTIFKMAGIPVENPIDAINKFNYEGNGIITDLPNMIGRGFNHNKLIINWKQCVNMDIKISYKEKEYLVKIIKYDNKSNKLTIKYQDNPHYIITTEAFKNGFYGALLGLDRSKDYIYDENTIVETKYNKIKLVKQTRVPNGKYSIRAYEYECLNCGNKDTINEYCLKDGKGCNTCCPSPIKIVKEINSVWKTNPEIIKYFKNPKEAEKFSISSCKKLWFTCPRCGTPKFASLNNISGKLIKGYFSCEKCGDTKSYPEKFMFNLLSQINNEFETQKKFNWSENRMYDFYLESNSTIIETHGAQHYVAIDTGKTRRRSLDEEQENDKLKEKLALENNINNYIIVDCRESDLDFIKNNILNSKLNELLDLSNIDWLKCHEHACSSLVKKTCDLWSNGIRDTVQIGKIIGLNRNGVGEYLKKGKLLGWCDYDPKEVMAEVYKQSKYKNALRCGKPLICLENGLLFKSTADCSHRSTEVFGVFIRRTSIGQTCNEDNKSSRGYHFKYIKDLTEDEKLEWNIEDKLNKLYTIEELKYLKTNNII